MQCNKKKWRLFVSLLLVCILVLSLPGCSKEAKTEGHMKKGEQYFSENKIQEAILEFKNVVQLDPKDAKAHYKLG